MFKKIFFFLTLILLIFFLGKNLNPFDGRMFSFHDDTQVARIEQFTLNLTNGIVPPRVAPDISYRLGFPVFNFYSPFSYWVTTAIHFIGIPSPIAIKTAFLLGILASFIFMLSYLRLFFRLPASLLGAVCYASSLWMAVEIFVRGNLAEVWFIALFPLSLYFLTLNTRNTSKLVFALTTFALSAAFTVHNVFSLLAVGIFFAYSLILPHKKRNLLSIILALGLGSYFLVPALTELKLTYASFVATKTHYQDHFLCGWQMWNASHWGFGGSAPGCSNDDMAYTLGKLQIILGVLGLLVYLFHLIRKRRQPLFLFVVLLGVVGALLTTYASKPIWDALRPVFSLFQFPWRFLIFPMFSLAFFAAYGLDHLPQKLKYFLSFLFIFTLLYTSSKYFFKPWLYTTNEYMDKYGNTKYIDLKAGYNMAEYLPKTADYSYWRSLEDKGVDLKTQNPAYSNDAALSTLINESFRKEVSVKNAGTVTLNLHYFPFWTIYIDDILIHPKEFDKLGRPLIKITKPSIIHVFYEQTIVEQFGNTITLFAFLVITGILLYKPVWIQPLKKSHS